MLISITAAIRFLTRIPIPGAATEPIDVSRAVAWFPLVGAIIGFLTAFVHVLASNYWPPKISALLTIVFGLLLTGGLHEDGAADAADGLGGGWNSSQIIAIMRDSSIGTYGAIVLWILLTLRWTTFITLNRMDILIILPIAMAWSRWAIVAMLHFLPTASPGLSGNVQDNMSKTAIITASIIMAIITLMGYFIGYHHVWKLTVTAVGSTIVWVIYLKRRIGGQTGDLLGAGNQLVETVVLLSVMTV
jgi:adenosylcobinamide-GDP ribazoletransferase